VVLSARAAEAPQADQALETLCRLYWHPIYAFVRRKGFTIEDAQDLTQEFFAELIARRDFARIDRSKGKFRSFLLASLQHFLANEWHKRHALKRGGGRVLIPFEATEAEEGLAADLASDMNPERLFDRRWASTVLQRAIAELRREWVAQDKEALFAELSVFLTETAGAADYDAPAARLGMTVGAVATSVHRLRKRYRELVRATLAQTVTTPLELEEEMRYLLEVCG
jgi:RNA polymerase sigma-70 factor (ECF subfamily)